MGPLFGELNDEVLAQVRERQASALAPTGLSGAVARTDVTVPGPRGAPDVVLRVHRPEGCATGAPCLYSIHGGGYVMGSYVSEDMKLQRICLALGCVATSVEYRLAPETRYPGALEDCYAGLAWVHAHAAELGVDPTRVGIGGGSAGGGLAAALAILARDRSELPVAFQLLLYPMLDDRHCSTSSRWDAPVWNPAHNRYGWRAYLGPLDGTDGVPATAAPARATDLSGLPPAFIAVGSADMFVDEDIAYSQALLHAGVPTELHVYPGGVHGFESLLPDDPLSVRARRDVIDWLVRVTDIEGRSDGGRRSGRADRSAGGAGEHLRLAR